MANWISVNERLPEESGRYWCYAESIEDLGTSHYQWNYAYSAEEKRFNVDDGDRVTHWMPLVEPPKQEGANLKPEITESRPTMQELLW